MYDEEALILTCSRASCDRFRQLSVNKTRNMIMEALNAKCTLTATAPIESVAMDKTKGKSKGQIRTNRMLRIALLCLGVMSVLSLESKGNDQWEMGPFVKHGKPILSPKPESRFHCPVLDQEVRWEEQNVFNPAAVVKDGKVYLLYRADDKNPDLKWGRTCRIGLAYSEDGVNFTRHPEPVLYPDNDPWKQYEWEAGVEDLHIIEGEDGIYYMNYTTHNGEFDTVSVATSPDLYNWTKHGPAFLRQAGQIRGRTGVVVSQMKEGRPIAAKINGKYWMYYTHGCLLAWSDNLIDWVPVPGKAAWPGKGYEAGAIALLRDDGILLMTQSKHPSLGDWVLRQGLFDRHDLTRVLREQKEPFLYPEYDWEKRGFIRNATVSNGMVYFEGKWMLYYGAADRRIGLAVFSP